MNPRIQQLLVPVATVGTIIFNWMAATGILGGVETKIISDKNPTLITPAGYAFAIWSLIYIGLIAFSIYQALPRNAGKYAAIRTLFLLSCVLNGAWLYLWALESLVLCLVVIALLLVVLLAINSKLRSTEGTGEYWLVKAPFGIYAGWVTAATLVNLTIVLASKGSTLASMPAVAASFIFVAAAAGIFFRIIFANHMYPLAIAWALTAIAVKQSGATLIVASCAVGVIACLIATVSFVMETGTSKK